jgi:hypothetical protein
MHWAGSKSAAPQISRMPHNARQLGARAPHWELLVVSLAHSRGVGAYNMYTTNGDCQHHAPEYNVFR